jgi:GNAT superfamily N-acetyltransferase
MIIYRHFNKKDLQQIDDIFKLSTRSIRPGLIHTMYLFIKWIKYFYIILFVVNKILNFNKQNIINYFFLGLYLLFYLVMLLHTEIYIYRMYPSYYAKTYINNTKNSIYVAVNTNKIVGFCSLKSVGNGNGWMTYHFVHPDYQHKGIGKKLVLDFFCDFAKKKGYKIIKGGTSSVQYTQVNFMSKYARIVPFHKYWFLPVHGYYFIWDLAKI